ncbi:MAG: MGMT family protein [Myxococcales bacterium]|jgi:methylated-DNA-protein-cysteine methyltransferase-like protein
MAQRSGRSFLEAVEKVVRAIPRGRTLSYSEVALRAGKPRGARAVVRALHVLDDVPWWRVIRADGTLAREVAREQAQLLATEGTQRPTAKSPRRTRAAR